MASGFTDSLDAVQFGDLLNWVLQRGVGVHGMSPFGSRVGA
jgi:hypothetical protein